MATTLVTPYGAGAKASSCSSKGSSEWMGTTCQHEGHVFPPEARCGVCRGQVLLMCCLWRLYGHHLVGGRALERSGDVFDLREACEEEV